MSKGNISKPQASKPNALLQFFGCCGEGSLRREKKPQKQSLIFPSSQIDILNPPNKLFKGSFQGHYPLDDEVNSNRNGSEVQKSLVCLSHAHPVNEVFILGNKSKIVAYITRKKIYKDSSMQASLRDSVSSLAKENMKNISNSNGSSKAKWSNLVKNCASIENKKDGLSKEERRTNSNTSNHVVPDSLGPYLGYRLRCNTLLNLACGCVEITRNLACFCNLVVAMDKDLTKLNYVKTQAEMQEFIHKIDFIHADFLHLRDIKADIVYIDPLDCGITPEHTTFEEIKPSLYQLIPKAFKASKGSVVIKLPVDTNIEELAELFRHSLNDEKISDRFCIEIEEIINLNQEVENIVVYFGDCSSIEVKDEYKAIYEYIAANQQPNWRFSFPLQVIGIVLEKIGVQRSLNYIHEIENIISNKITLPYSFFDGFLDKALSENVITTQDLAPIITKESKKSSSFIFSIANSYNSNITLLQRGSSMISSHNLVGTVEDSRYKKGQNKDELHAGYNPFLSQGSATQSSRRGGLEKANLLDQYNAYTDFNRKKPFSLKDIPYNNSMDSQEMKNCFEMSNLEHSLSSAGGDFMKEFNLKMLKNEEADITLTEDHLNLSDFVINDGKKLSSGFGKILPRSRSFKVKEVSGNYQVREGDENGGGVKNKENGQVNKEKEDMVVDKKKSEFFVKKKNAFFTSNQG